MLRLGLWALVCLPVLAQLPSPQIPGNLIPPAPYFPELNTYLGLTNAQTSQLSQNLTDYFRLVSERRARITQVQSEIRDETAKSPLNPSALGIRYAEVEAICRNVQEEAAATQRRSLGLLTVAQAAKLKVLDDAVKLLPVINESRSAGVLTPPSM